MSKIKTFTAKVGDDGRVTIPEPIRTLLGITQGDLVEMNVTKEQ